MLFTTIVMEQPIWWIGAGSVRLHRGVMSLFLYCECDTDLSLDASLLWIDIYIPSALCLYPVDCF